MVAIGYIAKALILSGMAITLCGISRPASGAEHIISHYWKIDKISRKLEHALHGNLVGVGIIIATWMYKKLNIEEKYDIKVPSPEEITKLLERIGVKTSPKTIGIEKELFNRSIVKGVGIRPRYTILKYVKDENKLEEFAHKLTNLFYGE